MFNNTKETLEDYKFFGFNGGSKFMYISNDYSIKIIYGFMILA